MSDQDDLKRLDSLLADGRITQEEYESERAWILGGEESVAASAPRAASGSHVIDLHEIEALERVAAAASRESTAADRSSMNAGRKDATPQRRIPTVWKVILAVFVVWILLLATAVVFLRIHNSTAAATQAVVQSTAGAQTQAGSETAQTAAQELQENTAEASYEAFVTQLETTLGTYYGNDYSVTDDGKTLTVSLMGDGIAADAMYVVQGADGAAEIWSELKTSMQALAVTCFDGANGQAPERHVVLNILNDQNQENVILSYLDGTCIYDATETADLTE